MRGIRFVNIPTTLLAMVDASSGGKTGFDYQGVKNLIGTFTLPLATLIYPDLLRTLPTNELLSGFAEMLKHALIASKEEWVKLLQIAQEELPYDPFVKALENTGALQASMAIKENVVAQDPCETGWRKILNFGHTVGHAIESAALEHDALPHGYCVLWGMVAELYLSVAELGFDKEVLTQLSHLMLAYYGRPACNCKERERLVEWMMHDKKNKEAGQISFTLLRAVGDGVVDQTVSREELDEALEYVFSL
jgi:3-dehydroquinate synthase